LRHDPAPVPPAEPDVIASEPSEPAASMADQIPTDLNEPAPPNVVPFRSSALTPAENSAFNELGRQLAARLQREYTPEGGGDDLAGAAAEPTTMESPQPRIEQLANKPPEWLMPSEPPALGESRRDRALLDLLPTGVLIYRFDHLLYANPAFLERMAG